MALQLECVAAADGMTTATPCPAGHIVVAVERPIPVLLDDWGSVAALSAAMVLTSFAAGLGAGWVTRMMEGR